MSLDTTKCHLCNNWSWLDLNLISCLQCGKNYRVHMKCAIGYMSKRGQSCPRCNCDVPFLRANLTDEQFDAACNRLLHIFTEHDRNCDAALADLAKKHEEATRGGAFYDKELAVMPVIETEICPWEKTKEFHIIFTQFICFSVEEEQLPAVIDVDYTVVMKKEYDAIFKRMKKIPAMTLYLIILRGQITDKVFYIHFDKLRKERFDRMFDALRERFTSDLQLQVVADAKRAGRYLQLQVVPDAERAGERSLRGPSFLWRPRKRFEFVMKIVEAFVNTVCVPFMVEKVRAKHPRNKHDKQLANKAVHNLCTCQKMEDLGRLYKHEFVKAARRAKARRGLALPESDCDSPRESECDSSAAGED